MLFSAAIHAALLLDVSGRPESRIDRVQTDKLGTILIDVVDTGIS